MIMYFKKYKDTLNGTNWEYDNNCLSIDDNFSNFSINIPERKINEYSIYGQGSVIIPTYFFENRIINFSYRNKKINNTIFTNEKDDLFLRWFYSNDEIFLVRNTEKGLQKIKGIFQLKTNEKYKNYAISGDIDIQFITEDSFFENVTKTEYTKTISNQTEMINIVNSGFFTGWIIEYENAQSYNEFEIQYNNYYFKLQNLSIQLPTKLIINMTNFTFLINNNKFFPIFSGQSFYIESGESIMIIKTNGLGTVKLQFFERYI